LKRSDLASIEVLPRYLPGKNEKRTRKLSVRIADVWPKSATKHLASTDLERYRYDSLLGVIHFNIMNFVSYMPINVSEVWATVRTETARACFRLQIWNNVRKQRELSVTIADV
jgi:hypothetical protein